MEMEELWLPYYENENYLVSNLGRVIGPYGRVLVGSLNKDGYRKIGLRVPGATTKDKRKTRYIHLMVAETFLGKRPAGKVCDHKNRDKTDNRVENLRWVSHSENTLNTNSSTRARRHTPKEPILQLDPNTQKIIARFSGYNEASEKLGLSQYQLRKNLNGHRKDFKIGKFVYESEYNDSQVETSEKKMI